MTAHTCSRPLSLREKRRDAADELLPPGGRWPEGPDEGPPGDFADHRRASGRVDAVDCARGLALVGMAVYHFSWDLADFRLASPMLPFTPQMRLLSHIVASVFLALVGLSLALAHRNGLNVRAFWRRVAIVAGAAALVTAGSFVFAPSEPITFGILHCIAAASLIAAPFVNAPAWASLAMGVAAIAAPWLGRSTLFDPPWLLWIGLGEALPNTLDWRPLLPWAGVVFLLGFARLPERARVAEAAGALASQIGAGSGHRLRRPAQLGRLSHPPADPDRSPRGADRLGPLAPKADRSAFLASCQRACVAQGRVEEECESGCECVADAVDHSGDADRLAAITPERRSELKRLADACMGRWSAGGRNLSASSCQGKTKEFQAKRLGFPWIPWPILTFSKGYAGKNKKI